MANNQYVNKVVYNDSTLVDLTGDTVSPESLLSGYTAHDRSGAPINGAAVIPTKVSDLVNDVGYLVETDIVDDLTSTATDKPLSAAQGKALNEAVTQSTALSSLPITRIENDYVDSASINRLAAYKRAGISTLYGNLALSAELPLVPTGGDSSNFLTICKIEGWTCAQDSFVNVPCRDNGTKVLLVSVRSNGVVQINTTTAPCPASFYRFVLSAM